MTRRTQLKLNQLRVIIGAWIIVVGPGSAEERRRDRDLGARLLFHDVPSRRVWGVTIRRLIASLQRNTSFLRTV